MLTDDPKRHIRDRALEACKMLNDMLLEINNELPKDEFDKLKKTVGTVLGEIGTEILFPLYEERPDLAPGWFKRE